MYNVVYRTYSSWADWRRNESEYRPRDFEPDSPPDMDFGGFFNPRTAIPKGKMSLAGPGGSYKRDRYTYGPGSFDDVGNPEDTAWSNDGGPSGARLEKPWRTEHQAGVGMSQSDSPYGSWNRRSFNFTPFLRGNTTGATGDWLTKKSGGFKIPKNPYQGASFTLKNGYRVYKLGWVDRAVMTVFNPKTKGLATGLSKYPELSKLHQSWNEARLLKERGFLQKVPLVGNRIEQAIPKGAEKGLKKVTQAGILAFRRQKKIKQAAVGVGAAVAARDLTLNRKWADS